MTYALGKHCSIQLSYEGRVEHGQFNSLVKS